MKKMIKISVLALAIIAVSSMNVYAGHGKGSCGKCEAKASQCKVTKLKKKMSMYWAYKDKLGLSEEQLGKIADIKHTAMKQLIRESAEVKVIKVDVKAALWADQIDTAQVNKLIDSKYAAKSKVSKTFVKALADAQKVLNDEQRAKMTAIKTKQYLKKKGYDSSCSKCSSGKICPITGKSLEAKGSGKE